MPSVLCHHWFWFPMVIGYVLSALPSVRQLQMPSRLHSAGSSFFNISQTCFPMLFRSNVISLQQSSMAGPDKLSLGSSKIQTASVLESFGAECIIMVQPGLWCSPDSGAARTRITILINCNEVKWTIGYYSVMALHKIRMVILIR